MKRILASSAITLASIAACTPSPQAVRDASIEHLPTDPPPDPTDVAALVVDFTVENCPHFDAQTYTCTGNAPLNVRFVPLATATIARYLWNFGDASAFGSDVAPSHTYLTPGTFSVRLVAAALDGTSSDKVHTGFIVVRANAIGQTCDASSQCEQGLFCLCSASSPCDYGPSHGICISNCYSGQCQTGDVCANLFTAMAPLGKAEPWQAPVCLPGCTSDSDCSGGLRCRTLPPGPTTSGWVHGCFAALPGNVGDSCLDADGALRDDLCASGYCADLGSKGLCSADCSVTSCPPGSDCALLADGRKLCLQPCVPSLSCSDDPLVACVSPAAGVYTFQVGNATKNSAAGYCFPPTCLSDDQCPASGTCIEGTGTRYCVKPN